MRVKDLLKSLIEYNLFHLVCIKIDGKIVKLSGFYIDEENNKLIFVPEKE